MGLLFKTVQHPFSRVGLGCDLVRSDDTSYRTHSHPQDLTTHHYADPLFTTLEIGFHLVVPDRDQPASHFCRTSHHEWMFEVAFSNDNDEVIADAMSIWIVDDDCTPLGSFGCYFFKRTRSSIPFSPRLRWVSVCAGERIELEVSGLETVRLLNCPKVVVDEVTGKHKWGRLLVDVIHSPTGFRSLSSH